MGCAALNLISNQPGVCDRQPTYIESDFPVDFRLVFVLLLRRHVLTTGRLLGRRTPAQERISQKGV